MWAALLDAIHMDDEVTLDITHAFRHMPVLASFMLGALRWVRNLKKVDLYYGAYDMVEKGETVKVLHLPLVNELMNVAEAAATYEHTGNYGHILDVLGFKGDAEAEAVVYADELNRNAVDEATGLAERVKNIHDKPIAAALKPRVKEALRWVASKGLARQMGHKSMRACSNGQYSNAIALLYEAIRVAGCDDSSTTVKQDGRKEHNERIDGWKKVFTSASDQEKSILNDVEYLRNAVLHGLPGGSQKVERALKEPTHFHNIMEKGYRLLDRYLTSRGK